MRLVTDIDQVRILAESKEEENWRFRSFLKGIDLSIDDVDNIVHKLFSEIAPEVDCHACANCCKEISPELLEEDIQRLAKHLETEMENVIAEHLGPPEMGDGYTFRKSPCPFLRDNRCEVYDARPRACRSFPHLHKKEFVYRLIQVVQNCSVCPIVYNVFEQLKENLWHFRT